MDRASTSPIALVEAAYNLELGPAEWLPNLLRAGGSILDLGQGCAATLWAGTSSRGEPLVSQLHAENGPPDLAMRFARAVREVDSNVARATLVPGEPGVHTLAESKGRHPEAHDALTKHVGCKDMLALWATDSEHHGVGIHIPSATVIAPSRKDRERWHMLSVHIAAGHHLRRRLAQTPRGTPVTQIPLDAVALLDPKHFSVAEAAGEAKNHRALDEIRRAAIGVDLARARLRNGETCEALRLWDRVLRGRSSTGSIPMAGASSWPCQTRRTFGTHAASPNASIRWPPTWEPGRAANWSPTAWASADRGSRSCSIGRCESSASRPLGNS